MKISYNWLSRYLSEIPDPLEAAELLTLSGLEVEETEQTGSDFSGIVVGDVLDVQPHPNADKLVICHVDVGKEDPSQIICGAPNVAAGQKVPVATVGTVLPKPLPDGTPFIIRKTKIRGQKSEGMICAEDELGLGDDHSGILVLNTRATAGTPFSEVSETGKDTVFEIELTPNRPDATCHIGVARDLAAVTGASLKKPFDSLPEITDRLKKGAIRITDSDKCHRYVGILMRGVTIGESPQWLKELLKAIGLRPVNNVVDVTNFVLQETGQPLHAFDVQQLAGERIDVRSFDSEMKFTTLDEVERTVPAGALFICYSEKPVALAGVMGGLNSEISEHTTDLLIESAWFEPTGIRKTARNLGLQTDSSYRFERGVDPAITKTAALRCAGLILEMCGGDIKGMEDVHPVKPSVKEIDLRHSRLNLILGMETEPQRVTQILGHLEISTVEQPSHSKQNPGQTEEPASGRTSKETSGEQAQGKESKEDIIWRCTIPAFRPDITSEIDLIEEVARILNYNNIPDPERITIARPEPVPFREQFRENVRRAASSAGLKEIYTNSLLPESLLEPLGGDAVVITTLNPITKDQALLRTSLLYGFLRSAAYNFNRDVAGVRFFETGNIFRKESNGGTWINGIYEATHLHLGIAGKTHTEHWKAPARTFDLFDLKALVLSILQRLRIEDTVEWKKAGEGLHLVATSTAGKTKNESAASAGAYGSGEKKTTGISPVVGTLFPVDREWKKRTEVEETAFSAELNLDRLQQLSEQKKNEVYQPVSRFPSFEFDLALVVDKNIPAGDLQKSMKEIAGIKLIDIDVFDVFEGGSLKKHQKSIAFRLTFQDNEKTLTINDIEPVIQKILKEVKAKYSAVLRS